MFLLSPVYLFTLIFAMRSAALLKYTKSYHTRCINRNSNMADDVPQELHESLLQFDAEEPSSHLILVAVQKCIESGKWKELVDCLTLPKHEDALEFVGWDLVAVISQAFIDDVEVDGMEELNRILRVIAETCSAKEVCIGVLEQLDAETSFHLAKFVILLDILKIAISRLKDKKLNCVSMVLPCILRRVTSIQLSDELIGSKLNKGKGRNTLVMECALECLMDFIKPLVQEISMLSSCSERPCSSSYTTSLHQEILRFLIQLLDYPLTFVDLANKPKEMIDSEDEDDHESNVENKSEASLVLPYRHFAQEVLEFIQMAGDPYVSVYLMEFVWKQQTCEKGSVLADGNPAAEEENMDEEVGEEQEKMAYPVLGLSCFMYLLLVEELGDVNFPAVFSFKYLLRVNMKYVLCLLSRTEHCIIYKGLELLDVLSARLQEKCLEYRQDEFKFTMDVVKALINVMTMCSSKKLRVKGVRVFPNLMSKLDTRSQYGLLYTFLQDCDHAGVAGLLIYLLKEQVHQTLCSTVEEPWFQGTRLMSLLQLVLKPPSGAGSEKDLVQETDRIMAILNCLRFILLRDSTDKTTVWENFPAVENNFLDPLRETLKVTRIQYQAELLSKQDEMAGNKRKKVKDDIEFNIKIPDGKSLELMPLKDQCEALQSGLYSLDMMESVLVRMSEIANSRKKEKLSGCP